MGRSSEFRIACGSEVASVVLHRDTQGGGSQRFAFAGGIGAGRLVIGNTIPRQHK